VEQAMSGMWGLGVMGFTGTVGFLLCLPVAVLAAWRAGMLRWWGALAPIAGLGVGLMVVGANVPGWAVMTAGYIVLSIGLARAGRAPEPAQPADQAEAGQAGARAVPLDA
jgi:hypothetical protein